MWGRECLLLEFYDCERSVVWWSVGIGLGHLTSTTQAAFDGYRFALDPRRTELQKKPLIHSGHELR